MVSGRLGNDQYDFSVMADNTYPEGSLQTAWQTAASMFDETWSYRSWQKGGRSHQSDGKLRSLINVVSHGGNFLLNIGPKGDGSVVPFEREVLKEIGIWLKKTVKPFMVQKPLLSASNSNGEPLPAKAITSTSSYRATVLPMVKSL